MTSDPVLILGARSDIAIAIAHAFAKKGHAVQLAARNADTLSAVRDDLTVRYSVGVSLHEFDVLDTAGFEAMLANLPALPGIAISVVGHMGVQAETEAEPDKAIMVLRTNFEGPAAILTILANRFAERGSGTLIGIASVAGLRGRASNYVYGSAKAGFIAFLSGLRARLSRGGVRVITVLPGFVATRMTEGMALPQRLVAQPDEVARAIERAVTRGKDVVYVRPIWWPIMLIIRTLPEPIFKRLKF